MSDFTNRIELTELHFSKLADRIRRAVPKAHLITKPFEMIKDGSAEYLSAFFTAAGANPTALQIDDNVVRPRLSLEQAERLRKFARRLPTTDRPQKLKRRAALVMETPVPNPTTIKLPPETVAELKTRYANDISYAPSLDG